MYLSIPISYDWLSRKSFIKIKSNIIKFFQSPDFNPKEIAKKFNLRAQLEEIEFEGGTSFRFCDESGVEFCLYCVWFDFDEESVDRPYTSKIDRPYNTNDLLGYWEVRIELYDIVNSIEPDICIKNFLEWISSINSCSFYDPS